MARKKKPKDPPETWPMVVETYALPYQWMSNVTHPNLVVPACWSGFGPRVTRYRVTVEKIDEPEAERERLQALWRQCTNWHHYEALMAEAQRLGIELDREQRGVDSKKMGGCN